MIRSWVLTRGFALLPGTRNRYEIWYTRTQHRLPSRQVNDHGRVSGTHRGLLAGHDEPGIEEPAQRHSSGCGVEAGAVRDRGFGGAAWPQAQHRQDRSLAGLQGLSRRSGGGGDRRHGGGTGHSVESSCRG